MRTRAGQDERARAALRLKGEVCGMVSEAARWKKAAGGEEGMLALEAAKWADNADAWATGEFRLDGNGPTMLAEKAMLHEGADEEWASSAEMSDAAAEDGRAAAAELERAADEAKQEAAAALGGAMAAAKRAAWGRDRAV